jgi:hypothetical protein
VGSKGGGEGDVAYVVYTHIEMALEATLAIEEHHRNMQFAKYGMVAQTPPMVFTAME